MTARRSWARPLLLCVVALGVCVEPTAGSQAVREGKPVCCAASPSTEAPKSCDSCSPGTCCGDKWCASCRKLPRCQEGEKLYCSGTTDFRYFCKPCPNGTFSDPKKECCTPWTDCERAGLLTVHPGSATRDARCGRDRVITKQEEPSLVTFLFVLTSVGIGLLVLLTFVLVVCTWMQKEKFPLEAESEAVYVPECVGSQLLHADACSFQFPEEEHGDKMPEETPSLKSLPH
ncbi:tumor necrosis factor receptor superfamily member 18 [Varanus komodoensis]|uniref:tumor necrosis factor receptor superfamily member 18 n=1 Tax=Varanus komodoensis TaxID=61221 RepID=UPI001CF7980E|nr:tumor necrosis factor receptor superfamily member 18 [Varanus komodoensis]